jgi:iron complex outermembrane receptor protein
MFVTIRPWTTSQAEQGQGRGKAMTKKTIFFASVASVLISGSALAQTTAPAAGAAADTAVVLEDVVVTAQRRNENLQTTAAAVAVLSGEALEKKSIRDLRDLQNATPSLTVSDAGILTFANIRGIGLNLQSPTVVSGVATYRDGLFSPSPIFLNEGLFDISAIEVLRGPQGTFVGQNSTGGAIFQTSRSPEIGDQSGYVEAQVGDYADVKLDGAVNLPVSSTLAARVAFSNETRDSFYTNLGSGLTPGDVHQTSARIGLLWKPSENLSALFKTEFNQGRSDGYAQQPIPGTYYAALDPSDPFVLDYDRTDLKRNERSIRNALEVKYVLPSGVTLRSVSGYQYGDQHFINDNDGTSSPEAYQDQSIIDRVYSQEINLISPVGGRANWVIGGSYVRQTARLDLHIYNARFPFGPGGLFPTQDTFIKTINPKTSAGAFAQLRYEVTDRLEVEVGGRYSYDKQTQEGILQLSPTPPLPGVIDASRPRFTDSNLTGKLSANFKVDEDNFLYAFVANGFKAGGVNLPAGTVASEKVVDYEAGWKTSLWDRHVRAQLNAFYMDYKNLQLNVFNPDNGATTSVANAGKSTIYGGEAQVQGRVGRLGFDASASYVKSKLGNIALIDTRQLPGGSSTGLGVQCPAGTPSNPPVCFDYAPFVTNLSGRRNPYSPELTLSGGVEYNFELSNGDVLSPRLDTAYVGRQSVSVFEDPARDIIPSRQIWNLQLVYEHAQWRATAYATNLTDKVYVSGLSNDNVFYGAPRQVGVRVTRSF